MTDSLRALLTGAIDYAGMFPPAGLSLDDAVDNFRRYLSGPYAWMLGRFVCPAAQLSNLARLHKPGDYWRRTVVVPIGTTQDTALDAVGSGLAALARDPGEGVIDTLELRWPFELSSSDERTKVAQLVQSVTSKALEANCAALTFYFEFVPAKGQSLSIGWHWLHNTLIEGLAYQNSAVPEPLYLAGLKIRMGGMSTDALPDYFDLARIICKCRDCDLFWKATAGLHHAIAKCDNEKKVHAHGFLNVFSAVVLADVHRLDVARVAAILEDRDAGNFRFESDQMSYQDLTATVDQITTARRRLLRSFGSCSFEEPLADLKALGLL